MTFGTVVGEHDAYQERCISPLAGRFARGPRPCPKATLGACRHHLHHAGIDSDRLARPPSRQRSVQYSATSFILTPDEERRCGLDELYVVSDEEVAAERICFRQAFSVRRDELFQGGVVVEQGRP